MNELLSFHPNQSNIVYLMRFLCWWPKLNICSLIICIYQKWGFESFVFLICLCFGGGSISSLRFSFSFFWSLYNNLCSCLLPQFHFHYQAFTAGKRNDRKKKGGGLGWEKNVLKDKRKLGSLLFSTAYKQGSMIECWKLDLSSADFHHKHNHCLFFLFFFFISYALFCFALYTLIFFLVSYIQHILFQAFLRKDFFEIDILKCIFKNVTHF